MTDDHVRSSALNLGRFIGTVLFKGAYGHTVAEVLGVALALEQAVDGALTKALARDDDWAAEVFVQQVLGQLGRERKIEVLSKVLNHHGVQRNDLSALVAKIRNLFRLRDRIAHGSLIEPADDVEGLQIVGYWRGVSEPYNLLGEDVGKIVTEAGEALTELLPYALVESTKGVQQGRTATDRSEPDSV